MAADTNLWDDRARNRREVIHAWSVGHRSHVMLCSAIIHFLGIHVRPPPSPLASECEAVDDLPTPLTVLLSIMYPLNDALHTLRLGGVT